ncbi:hypothetical protein [Pedobacter paludis]|uniref:Ig-like domain-containing protein n=1 Tax=Pedobacter paludis TaxID=2203212 RepID=A0A317EUD6_9SPHI|nr:hypothetical protein [Pedobacter paludis]PWS30561.1 hypothetical protein DF947_16625 [Pedobacter paludis]
MKQKYTYYIFLLVTFVFAGFISARAQTITGTVSTSGCLTGGSINAASTGLGPSPQYQLLKDGVVVAPDASNPTLYTNTSTFSSLVSGSYVLRGRVDAAGTVYTSAVITVNNGYVPMTVVTPTKTVPCVPSSAVLTTTVSGGKGGYIYSIAKQSAPGTALQTSAVTNASTFSFAALPVDSYLISVTDNCGSTVTSASSISQSGPLLSDIKANAITIGKVNPGLCGDKILFRALGVFTYVSNGLAVNAVDKANFSWRLEYNGLSYGKDTNGDGNPDLNGGDFDLNTYATYLPLGITDQATALAGNPVLVLYDKCGNPQRYSPPATLNISITSSVCGTNGVVSIRDGSGATLYGPACYPVNFVFTSPGHPTINYTMNSFVSAPEGFVPGATYSITYVDALGRTTGLTNRTSITIPVTSANYSLNTLTRSTTVYDASNFLVYVSGFNNIGDVYTLKVVSTTVPSFVEYTYSYTSTVSGTFTFPPQTANPNNTWPSGDYVLEISGPCGIQTFDYKPRGYTGVLSSLTTTPVCGGFTVTGNTTLVDLATNYEIIIVSGPSNVGALRDLTNTTSSQPFVGLSYGTYVFGIRVKGGTTVFNTRTITYSAANAVKVDQANTGGFVCSPGATNGTLTIAATSNSPAPGNTLEYALSTDDGATFGAYQSGNTFTGLTNKTYIFRVKDGCGNIITQSIQIGVAAAPIISINGTANALSLCRSAAQSVQLDVDVSGATNYLWSGPGINATNKNLKNPTVGGVDLADGLNNYNLTITSACGTNSTAATLTITALSSPPVLQANQSLCATPYFSITNILISGTNIKWYADATTTVQLPSSTLLVDGTTYYATQTTLGYCESSRAAVKVTLKNCAYANPVLRMKSGN